MKKIVYPIRVSSNRIQYRNVKISIAYRDGRLSLVGDCSLMSGQIHQYLNSLDDNEYRLNPGWTEEMFRKLIDIWFRWHLNDMRAGCSHQRAMGWDMGEHLGKQCPICGYKYGYSWIFEPVPDKVIEWLFDLP